MMIVVRIIYVLQFCTCVSVLLPAKGNLRLSNVGTFYSLIHCV